MSLTAASVELTDGIKTLGEIWEATRAVWTDGVSQDFEQRFWRPWRGRLATPSAPSTGWRC